MPKIKASTSKKQVAREPGLPVYGTCVSHEEFHRDPAAVMRRATADGVVTMVDAEGRPRSVIYVPSGSEDG